MSACYDDGVTVGIDADSHRKRETRDTLGRLVKVEEYKGTYGSCSTDVGTPYATTVYEYDAMGSLVKVTDKAGNTTNMQYDSLGRKKSMTDPDMGVWKYEYYANGNLYKQTDAKGQTITFQYDALNRLKLKDYPTGTDVSYTYDSAPDGAFATYPTGRPSTMTDSSGTSKYYYDNMGRATATKKTIDGSPYTIQVGYVNGRMANITYPDNETISYSYGAGNELNYVRNSSNNYVYAYYPASDYTALLQPKSIFNGNGVNTTYQYFPLNSRLQTITTSNSTQQLLKLTYDYYPGGNIKSIDNPNTPAVTAPAEAVTYMYGTRPHFVAATTDGRIYTPDANGNMTSNGIRTIAYDYDNMPTSITAGGVTTSFVYDGSGARGKKSASYGTTVYIGQLYECRDNTCTKYIFANGRRIAAKTGGSIIYYHQDHLGSTRVVTDDIGANQETASYFPFGATHSDTGAVSVTHKYTSQEFDAETGLYYYNARYYDPALGRFISADTIVPNPRNPQAFNRYSYVVNNPMKYTDPSGHDFLKDLGNVIAPGLMANNAALNSSTGRTTLNHTSNTIDRALQYHMYDYAWKQLDRGSYDRYGRTVRSIEVTVMMAALGVPAPVAGGANGALIAAQSGGDISTGILVGSLSGFIPGVTPFGSGPWASFGNQIATDAIRGGVTGGVEAAMNGGNIGQGAARGATTSVVAGQVNNIIGHTVGLLTSGIDVRYDKTNDVFIYKGIPEGSITFGNVIVGDNDSILAHEYVHTIQYDNWGLGFLPAYVAQFPAALATFNNPFTFNLFEYDARQQSGQP